MNVLDFIFPRYCLECRKQGKYICGICLSKVEASKLICPVCRKWSVDGQTHSFCVNKLLLDGMHSFYKYEGVVRKAILALKYRFAADVAKEITEAVNFRFESKNGALIVPVPLHRRRENWRGFNQSAVLGRLVAEKWGVDFEDSLVSRLENTLPQVKLGRTERLRNISGKFAVNANASREALAKWDKIVIFDDVWTTGATIAEICKVLKKAGAKKVWGMSVARS